MYYVYMFNWYLRFQKVCELYHHKPSLVYCLFPVMACINFEDSYLFKEKSCALAIFSRNCILRITVIMKGILKSYFLHFHIDTSA